MSPNIWPEEAVLPGMKASVEELCSLIIDVAVLVAGACDKFAEKEISGYPEAYLQHMVSSSMTTKARLLHYFPEPPSSQPAAGEANGDGDDWCATHLDHGCLTGLTSAMFVDESVADPRMPKFEPSLPETLRSLEELPASPDPEAGLYVTLTSVHPSSPCICPLLRIRPWYSLPSHASNFSWRSTEGCTN